MAIAIIGTCLIFVGLIGGTLVDEFDGDFDTRFIFLVCWIMGVCLCIGNIVHACF